MQGKLFVVSAPSGCGKTSLVEAALIDFKGKYPLGRVITYTTRAPRAGEVNGIDYMFISVPEFQEKIEQNYFIEWSSVYKTFYGSPIHIIDEIYLGKSYICIVDYQGAESIKKIHKNACLIWIFPPNIETLKQRLVTRGKNSEEDLIFRLALATKEIKREAEQKFFEHHLLNDDFLTAKEALKNIVINSVNSQL